VGQKQGRKDTAPKSEKGKEPKGKIKEKGYGFLTHKWVNTETKREKAHSSVNGVTKLIQERRQRLVSRYWGITPEVKNCHVGANSPNQGVKELNIKGQQFLDKDQLWASRSVAAKN